MIKEAVTRAMLGLCIQFCLVSGFVHAQSNHNQIMFYNVENLFDTIDDPLINDAEFLPGGRYQWGSERYLQKVDRLGQVISGDGKGPFPVLVGLCEIENLRVLEALVGSARLDAAGYEIVHYDSPDERGIDVALLYQPNKFRILTSSPLSVRLPYDLDFRTRDILYVQGVMGSDTLHLYVNHWPSRRGGMEASEPKRVQAAKVLRTHLDSLSQLFPEAKVIIMGDLNDEPENRSVSEVLQAIAPGSACSGAQPICLFNLSMTIAEGEGTYYYWRDKKWNILDHMIVSATLLDSTAYLQIQPQNFAVVGATWMLKEEDGRMIPFSTFAKNYEGGYSDHLPVSIGFKYNEPPPPPRKCRWRKR
jgi:hypothetical protein